MYKLRSKIALVSRNTPYFRGKRRLGNALSSILGDLNRDEECVEIVEMKNGSAMQLDVRSKAEQWSYWTGYYDDKIIQKLSNCLSEECIVLDIGANIGFYSIALGRKVKKLDGKVYAFEPIKSNYDRLIKNIELNNLASNVLAQNIALGDVQASVKMSMNNKGNSLTGNAVVVRGGVPEKFFGTDSESKVQMVPLDAFISEHSIDKCDLIKIDIEGAECMFLRGAKSFLNETRPVIWGEFNHYFMSRYGDSFVDVVNLLSNYRFFQQIKHGGGNFVEIKDPQPNSENVLLVPSETPKYIIDRLCVI